MARMGPGGLRGVIAAEAALRGDAGEYDALPGFEGVLERVRGRGGATDATVRPTQVSRAARATSYGVTVTERPATR